MDGPTTLPLGCAFCGGLVTLQMADWRVTARADGSVDPDSIQHQTARWPCPYCQRENSGGLPGRVAWVTKRAGDSDAKH